MYQETSKIVNLLYNTIITTMTIALVSLLVIAITPLIKVFMKPESHCVTRYAMDEDNPDRMPDDLRYTKIPYTIYAAGSSNNPGGWQKVDSFYQEEVDIEVQGEISLCRSFFPKTNIPIPRINERSEDFNIILDPNQLEWKNIISKIYPGDAIGISLLRNNTDNLVSVYDSVNKREQVANCSPNNINTNPLCGRYSPYYGNTVISYQCDFHEGGCPSVGGTQTHNDECESIGLGSGYFHSEIANSEACRYIPREERCCHRSANKFRFCVARIPDSFSASEVKIASLPEEYSESSKLIDESMLSNNNMINIWSEATTNQCSYNGERRINTEFQFDNQDIPMWFTADNFSGLVYRFGNTNESHLGSNYKFLVNNEKNKDKVEKYQSNDQQKKIYMNTISANNSNPNSNFQIKFYTPNNHLGFTGGYVMNVKHTSCIGRNGNYLPGLSDSKRGKIFYTFSDNYPSEDSVINTLPQNITKSKIPLKTKIQISNKNKGKTLWMKIQNADEDHINSAGYYKVYAFLPNKNIVPEGFIADIIDRILNNFYKYSKLFNQKLSCQIGDKKCLPLMHYINILSIIFAMQYFIRFIITQSTSASEFITNMVKILLLSSITNPYLISLYAKHVHPILMHFTPGFITAISGYEYNMDDVENTKFSLIFGPAINILSMILEPRFWVKMLALLGNLLGPLMFLMIMNSLIIILVHVCDFIVSILFYFLISSFLITILPFILITLLFDQTRFIFDGWFKAIVLNTIRPIILSSGLILIFELYNRLLDLALGFSVCWKCVMPVIFHEKMAQLFCFSWFMPWGHSTATVYNLMITLLPYGISLLIVALITSQINGMLNRISKYISSH